MNDKTETSEPLEKNDQELADELAAEEPEVADMEAIEKCMDEVIASRSSDKQSNAKASAEKSGATEIEVEELFAGVVNVLGSGLGSIADMGQGAVKGMRDGVDAAVAKVKKTVGGLSPKK